jgi:hypothetical protein
MSTTSETNSEEFDQAEAESAADVQDPQQADPSSGESAGTLTPFNGGGVTPHVPPLKVERIGAHPLNGGGVTPHVPPDPEPEPAEPGVRPHNGGGVTPHVPPPAAQPRNGGGVTPHVPPTDPQPVDGTGATAAGPLQGD